MDNANYVDSGKVSHLCSLLSNQCISRQRLNPIRARCSITQRLFGDTSKSLQIFSEGRPSTSRSKKVWATFSGNRERHCLSTSWNSLLTRLSSGVSQALGASLLTQLSLPSPLLKKAVSSSGKGDSKSANKVSRPCRR